MTEEPKHKGIVRVIIAIVIIAAVLLVALLIRNQMASKTSSNSSKISGTAPTVKKTVDVGYFSLKTDRTAKIEVGKSVTIDLFASSEGRDIVAYDAIVLVDTEALTYNSATTARKEFTIYPYASGELVVITGSKGVGSDAGASFKDEKIATLTFTPKKKGKTELKMVKSYKKATAGMMTADKVDILRNIESLILEVE